LSTVEAMIEEGWCSDAKSNKHRSLMKLEESTDTEHSYCEATTIRHIFTMIATKPYYQHFFLIFHNIALRTDRLPALLSPIPQN